MRDKKLSIAVVGKGGVGKTAITSLMARIISETHDKKLLLIDADPTHPHLSQMVDLIPEKSLEEIRLNAVKEAHKGEMISKKLAERIDFNVYEGLAESKDFCLFSMGQPEGPGCFCPSNTLLRKVIESISQDFDLILIDCEAGLEQIHRMVLKSIDILVIITDISLRSIQTANSIRNTAKKFTNYKQVGVVVNKVKGNIDLILKKLEELDLPLFGQIPDDPLIMEFDLKGKPIINLPEESEALIAIKKIVKNHLLP